MIKFTRVMNCELQIDSFQIAFLASLFFVFGSCGYEPDRTKVRDKDELISRHLQKVDNTAAVPDSSAAIRIAYPILNQIYGEEVVKRKLPLSASLKNDSVWRISGNDTTMILGGTMVLEIKKKTGARLYTSLGE